MICAYCQVEKGHISVGLLVERLSRRQQAVVDSITYTIALVMCTVTIWRTVVKGIYVFEENPVSAILRIPDAPFVMLVAFGWFILVIAIFLHLRHMYLRVAGVER